MSYKCICGNGATLGHIHGCDNAAGCKHCCKQKGGVNEIRSGQVIQTTSAGRGVRLNRGGGAGNLNPQYDQKMRNLSKQYSILGGVVAPKRSAYTIMGMANPLAERPVNPLDTTLPSIRDNSAVSRFNDFNPYNVSYKRSPELVRNEISMRSRKSPVKYTVNVNTFQPMGSPLLNNKRK